MCSDEFLLKHVLPRKVQQKSDHLRASIQILLGRINSTRQMLL